MNDGWIMKVSAQTESPRCLAISALFGIELERIHAARFISPAFLIQCGDARVGSLVMKPERVTCNFAGDSGAATFASPRQLRDRPQDCLQCRFKHRFPNLTSFRWSESFV